MLSLFLIFSGSMKLSEFCKGEQMKSVTITNFDIPFSSCELNKGQSALKGVTMTTSYKAIVDYGSKYRTLRIGNGLKMVVTEVTAGDILDIIDIGSATLELQLASGVTEISGNLRASKKNYSNLYVKGGSFRLHKQQLLRIIHVNDIHCALNENKENEIIGFPKFMGYLKQERAKAAAEGYGLLTFDAGDYIQGMAPCAVTNGTVGIEAIIQSGYDAMTLGNHFFDFGHDVAYNNYQTLKNNGVNVVVANMKDSTPGQQIVTPEYVVKEINGVRIGIFGLLTPGTKDTTSPASVEFVEFDDQLTKVSQQMAKKLREDEKCTIVICIGHLGFHINGKMNSNFLAGSLDGIDVIVDGHSHTKIDDGSYELHNDYQTMIVQAGTNLQAIGIADLLIDTETKKVVGKKARLLEYDDVVNITPDPAASDWLTKTNAKVETILSRTVGKTDVTLPYVTDELRKWGNSSVAKFCASAFRSQTESDFGFINGGGVRAPLEQGIVTYGDLVSIQPFQNALIVLNLTGAAIKEIVAWGSKDHGSKVFSGFPFVSGLSYTIDKSKRDYRDPGRIIDMQIIRENGEREPVHENEYYTVATTDFLWQGGDTYSMLVGVPQVETRGTTMDILFGAFQSLEGGSLTGKEGLFNWYEIKTINENRLESPQLNAYEGDETEYNVHIDNLFEVPEGNPVFEEFFWTLVNASGYKAGLNIYRKSTNNEFANYLPNALFVSADVAENVTAAAKSYEAMMGELQICQGFKKFNEEGKCAINTGYVVVFSMMMVVSLVIIVLAVIFICKFKKSPDLKAIVRETQEYLNPLQ